MLGKGNLLTLPGGVLLLAGTALIWIGVQRARFRRSGHGPGAVQIDEGQISYFGPLTGGAVALRELTSLTLDHGLYPAHWRLRQPDQPELLIPVNAEGADGLFDAFSTLPGLRMDRVITALESRNREPIHLWKRDLSRASTQA